MPNSFILCQGIIGGSVNTTHRRAEFTYFKCRIKFPGGAYSVPGGLSLTARRRHWPKCQHDPPAPGLESQAQSHTPASPELPVLYQSPATSLPAAHCILQCSELQLQSDPCGSIAQHRIWSSILVTRSVLTLEHPEVSGPKYSDDQGQND